jgi:hypothetical protein
MHSKKWNAIWKNILNKVFPKQYFMSRSKKKTPKAGITTAETEKENKRGANRKFRRISKIVLKKNKDEPTKKIREVSNVWAFDKDGKQFLKKPTKKDLRK